MRRVLPTSGVGIEFRGNSLHAVLGRGQWRGFCVADRLEIPAWREREPEECGTIYREFLRRNGASNVWTVVALPRSRVLIRGLRLPRRVETELRRAVEYEIDSLHPFEEGSVLWDCAVLDEGRRSGKEGVGREIAVLVALVRRAEAEELAGWFERARIPVSQFAVSTTLLAGWLARAMWQPPREPQAFFIVHEQEEGWEIVGCAPDGSVMSRERSGAGEEEGSTTLKEELERAQSEMRLEPEANPPVIVCGGAVARAVNRDETLSVEQVVPLAKSKEGVWQAGPLAVGGAWAAVERKGIAALNLLPPERRSYRSPLLYAPTYGLSALVLVLAVAVGLRGAAQDWIYSRYLVREAETLRPQVERVEALRERNRGEYERLAMLAEQRQRAAAPLAILEEITRLLPEDAWLQQFQYEGTSVTVTGTAASARAVLQAMSESDTFVSPQFVAPLSRTAEGKEGFRIGARVRPERP